MIMIGTIFEDDVLIYSVRARPACAISRALSSLALGSLV